VLDDEGARDEDRSDQVMTNDLCRALAGEAARSRFTGVELTGAFTEAASYMTSEWSWATAAAITIAEMIGTACGLVPRKCGSVTSWPARSTGWCRRRGR